MGSLPSTALMYNHEKIVPLKTIFHVFWWLLQFLRFIVILEQLCHEMQAQCLTVLKEL